MTFMPQWRRFDILKMRWQTLGDVLIARLPAALMSDDLRMRFACCAPKLAAVSKQPNRTIEQTELRKSRARTNGVWQRLTTDEQKRC